MGVTREEIVPGTVHLVDTGHDVHGKHLGGDKDIVLVPQPSSDPEDPLNWSPRRKGMAIGMVYCYTLGVAISTAVQYSVLTPISDDTGLTIAELNLGTGLMFLFLGWANLIWQPLALTFGRRGVYVISSFLCIWPVLWSAYSKSAGEWYAHRIILGIFAAPIESLPEVSVPDLFFAHNRGAYMGIYAFLLFGGNFFAPILAGWIDVGGGWRWTMYFGALVQAVTTIIIYFWMEETMYFRATVEGEEDAVQMTPDSGSAQGVVQPSKDVEKGGEKVVDTSVASSPVSERGQVHTAPKSLWKKLALFVSMPGRPSNKAMLTMMWRPLPLMWHFPSVSWAGFVYGTCLCWYNVLNATTSSILSAAPYNFSSGLVGTAYTSPLIAAALGALWSGWSTDRLALWLARRNHGIREPEHRLWALLLSGVLSAAGLILWGVGSANDAHWSGTIIGLGMLAFSVICGGSITLSYAVDCFKEISGEAMTSVIIIRNTLGFAVSYAINPWIDAMGIQNCFITVAMVALVCTFTFLPMVFIGKRLRKHSAPKYWEYIATCAVPGGH
ncbi:hypothetical protein N0V83_006873 [Neocucurbitaria cava]|uniref:Major facilitator superfamily (MFS) profile domain-containing protein n=1 Tax=Neocucurbitaria cava TaxID=798079 RepID=A0A9W8Y3X1_9PLEO|nr:hypothetical protein N0V83_006873 [Neocucurbitaria cava]